MLYYCRRQKGEQRVRTAAGNKMRREWIGFLFLLLLSVRDIREKKVNIIFILPAVIPAFYQMPDGFLQAAVPGFLFSILLFVLSFLTKEAIGMGDAFAVLLCACYLPFYSLFFIFVAGLFMAGVVGVFLILIRKGNRKTEIPYLPFLSFSYLIYLVSSF